MRDVAVKGDRREEEGKGCVKSVEVIKEGKGKGKGGRTGRGCWRWRWGWGKGGRREIAGGH